MKNDTSEKIDYIETHYPVECIKYKGLLLWPYIRTMAFGEYERQDEFISEQKNKFQFFQKIKKIINIFPIFIGSFFSTDLFLFFKKNSNIFFTDSGETRNINGKLISKIECEFVALSNIVVPFYQIKKGKKKAFKHYINRTFVDYLVIIKAFFTKVDSTAITGSEILYAICEELNIQINLKKSIKRIIATKRFYFYLFKKMKPKIIVVNCYYDLIKIAMISAAKSLKIPVIEMQHGFICQEHFGYVCKKEFYDNPYPDYLFCFGEAFKKTVSKGIYPENRIKIVGNYYIDQIKKNKSINRELFIKHFGSQIENKTIITVASQCIIDQKLLLFYKNVAENNKNYFIIYKVRPFKEYHKKYIDLLPNLKIENELDTYICMQNSDVTSTVSSTCAIESLVLGVPVLLVDIDGLATSYMKTFLGKELKSVEYVSDVKNASDAISRLMEIKSDEVSDDGNLFYPYGHKELLMKALKEVEEEYYVK